MTLQHKLGVMKKVPRARTFQIGNLLTPTNVKDDISHRDLNNATFSANNGVWNSEFIGTAVRLII
jgi:hypothetical protein